MGETSAEFEDLYEYMNSLKRIFDIRPALIYPGHGPLVTNGAERIKEYIEHRNKRNKQILEALKTSEMPLEPEDLVKKIYVGLHENLIPAACFNVSNHLDSLLKQKLVGEFCIDYNDCFAIFKFFILLKCKPMTINGFTPKKSKLKIIKVKFNNFFVNFIIIYQDQRFSLKNKLNECLSDPVFFKGKLT